MLSKHIFIAKIMIIKYLKIQMLSGNSLKMCVGAGFEISLTLECLKKKSSRPSFSLFRSEINVSSHNTGGQ